VGRIAEQNKRTNGRKSFSEDIQTLLLTLTDSMKHDVQAQFLKRRHPYAKTLNKALDDASITSRLLASFDEKWKELKTRLDVVPGKDVLSRLNAHLQTTCGIAITATLIIDAMTQAEVPNEMELIIRSLNAFAKATV
jgi:hypothetical protein